MALSGEAAALLQGLQAMGMDAEKVRTPLRSIHVVARECGGVLMD